MYLKAANIIGVPIEACYVFEDSQSGIESAKRANAKGIVKVASMVENDFNAEVDMVIKNYFELKAEDYL